MPNASTLPLMLTSKRGSSTIQIPSMATRTEAMNAPPPIPPHRDPDFVVAAEMAKQDAKRILQVYRTSPNAPPVELLNEAEELAKLPKPDERLVGLIGLSGVGKSSLICALQETPGIAIVNGIGTAVTCFPVYYRDRQVEHEAKYTVRCRFGDATHTEEVLESYVDDLNAPFDAERDEGATSEEIQEKARAAEDSFNILFGNMVGFDPKLLLIQEGKVTKDSAMEALRQWAGCLKWPEGMVDGYWHREIEDEDELQQILVGLSDSGLWPLIDNLTIFLEAPLLQNGVVLVDLPGYHDANYARVRIARETQQKCDDVFVVANINRAIDNPILQQVVKENIARPDAGTLTLQTVTAVCTHSADYTRDIEKLADQQVLRAAKAKVLRLRRSGADYDEITRAKHHVTKIIMAARNQKVEHDMHKKYGEKLEEGRFSVFCVDNALFAESEDEDFDNDPEEDVSGIYGLQQHVEDLPAKTLFQINNAVIGSRYRAMVYSFEMWVSSCRANPGTSNALLPEPEGLRLFGQTLRVWVNDILAKFIQKVVRCLRLAQTEFSSAALIVAQEWRSLYHTTVRALCKKSGRHVARGNQEHDWNDNLITVFMATTDANWKEFDGEIKTGLASLSRLINDAFQDYPRTCKQVGASAAFLEVLKSRQAILDNAAGSARDSFVARFGKLKKNFCISQEMCYVTDAMRFAYRRALEDKGKGVTIRRHETLEQHITDPDFVKDVCFRLHEEFEKLIEECSAGLLLEIEGVTKAIEADVENFQGKRENLPLFQLDPAFGQQAENLLASLKERKVQIEKLAENARKRAMELYGLEDALLVQTETSTEMPDAG